MLIKIYRLSNWLYRHGVPVLPKLLKVLNRIVFASVLPPSAKLGKNVLFSYEGLGTVIHKNSVIEDDVIIGVGVTIGGRSGIAQVPLIKRGAMIGAGAKILGPVTVGEYASVGANSVVLSDVPPYAVVVGMPAKVVRINEVSAIPDYQTFSTPDDSVSRDEQIY
jgi:serine O-acetyltransferase